ncbi:hypothetical protein pb186bvf_003767 [Paramecium bursaria]
MILISIFIRSVFSDGQYLSITQTYDCPLTCQNCLDSNQCSSCKTADRDASNMCVCSSKGSYSSDGSDECSVCTDPNCLECFYPNWCTACQTNSYMTLDFQSLTCVCQQGYFLFNGLCQVCDQTCVLCTGLTRQDCITCGESSFRILEVNQCNCVAGLYEDSESYICKTCSSKCSSCGLYYNACTSCKDAQHRVLIDNQCKCAQGYYDEQNQDICYQCNFKCLDCLNSISCTACIEQNNRVLQQGQCNCVIGYGSSKYIGALCERCHPSCYTCQQADTIDWCTACVAPKVLRNFYCVDDCYYSCLTCMSLNTSICTSCSSARIFNSGKCDCRPGTYDDSKNSYCTSCHYSCVTCTWFNDKQCTSCSQTRQLVENGFDKRCLCINSNQVDVVNVKECQNCHYSCITCQSNTSITCLTCDTNQREFSYGECLCKIGTYDVGINQCNICNQYCRTCNGPTNNDCLSCKMNYTLYGSQCLCSDGFYWDNAILDCLQCQYKCRTCVNPTSCTDCASLSYRSMPQCNCTDPIFKVALDGIYNCQQCNINCLDCDGTSLTTCTQCDTDQNRILNLLTSTCDCNIGYYDNGLGFCLNCSQFCESCIAFDDNCITCSTLSNRILNGNACICQDNYFEEADQNPNCQKCFGSCQTCNGSSSDQCLTCPINVNRIQQGTSCNCIYGYYQTALITCEQCQQPCLTCISVLNCLSCDTTLNRYYDQLTNACPCLDLFFDVGQPACSQCDYKCQTCSGDMYSCTSCPFNTNRVYDQNSKSCQCSIGYFDNGQPLCIQCFYSCLNCVNQSECTSCPSTRYLSGQQCLCNSGYYDASTVKNCLPCSIQCQTCQDTPSNCVTCPQTRYLQNNSCICSPGFLENGFQTCQNCDQKCKTCIGINFIDYKDSSSQCSSCDPFKFRTLVGQTCLCYNGYYENSVCIQCSSICKTCSNQFDNCLSCDSSLYRYLINNQCKCIDGFYDSGLVDCQSCDQKCLTCEFQQDNCLSCDNNKLRFFNQNQCRCIDGYFDDGFQTICQPCNQSCFTCSASSTFCLSCDSTKHLFLQQNQCICENGYVKISNGSCQICDKACQQCVNSPTSCTQCVQNRYLVLDQCYCIDGYYENNLRDCMRCDITCLTCIQFSNYCLTCNDLSNRVKQGSQCNCKDGYVGDGSQICQQCSYQCKTCQLQSDFCTSCSQLPNVNRILNNKACICLKGYYDNGNLKCQPCSYSCKECSNAVYCTACNTQNTFRIDQSKFGTCPCLNGFFDQGQLICQACSYQCATCLIPNECKTCKIVANSYRINQPFACPCQPGYFDDGQQITCQKCSPICSTCQTQSTNCLTCKGQFVSSAPDCQCIQSYYRDLKLNCSPCDWQCLTCINNQSNCSKCRGNRINKNCDCEQSFYEANLELCMPCSHQCLTCVTKSTQCTQCRGDRINSPKCICKDGFYDDEVNLNCAKCDYTCATCNIAGCITCAGNRILQGTFCNPPPGSVSYSFTPWCSTCTVAVLNITFAQTLEYINIQFDFPISFSSQQTRDYCSTILDQNTIQLLGQSPSCYQDQNNSQIIILKLGLQATINLNDKIQMISNSLIVKNCAQQIKFFDNIFVNFPTNIFAPQLQIISPTGKISPCYSININSGLQLYDGMRSLTNYQWIVSLPKNPSADINKLRGLLNILNQKQITTLEIQPFMIPENSFVEINVTYMSFAYIYNTTTINLYVGTKNTPLVYFDPEQMQVYSWQKVELIINYVNQICEGNNTVKANTSLNIKIQESSRVPTSAKQLQNYSQILGTPDQSQISIHIDSFTLSPNSVYYINVTGLDIEDVEAISYSVLQLTINPSPLLAQIVGGSRIQNQNSNYDVQAIYRDPDDIYDFNLDPNISYQMKCIDIQTNKNCQYANKQYIKLNETSIQHIAGGAQDSFTVQQWEIRVQKALRVTTSISLIILVDYQFPQISLEYPPGYQARQISPNEELYFTIKTNEDNVLFSFALIYNYQQVAVSNMETNQIKFKIWDYFNGFNNGDKINLKFQVQGLKTLLPAIADTILTIKQPPVGAQFIISPQNGTSFETIFSITILQAYDISLPLYYRFILFDSYEDYLSFNMTNCILLSDFQQSGYINQVLYTNQKQIIAGQVKNAQGSTQNFTLSIEISSSNFTCDNLIYQNDSNYLQLILKLKEIINQNISCTNNINQIHQLILTNIVTEVDNYMLYLYQKILQLTTQYLLTINSQQGNRILEQNNIDTQQIQTNLQQIQTLANHLLFKGKQFEETILQNINFGDPKTQNLQQINFYQKRNLLTLIDLLFIQIQTLYLNQNQIYYNCKIVFQVLQNISESFLNNILYNSNRIRYIGTEIGLNIIKVDKKKFNKIINQTQNTIENMDDAMKKIIVQLLVYKLTSNYYQFQENFNSQVQINKNITKDEITQYESPVLLNQSLYMMNLYYSFDGNNITVNFINDGYLTFYMGKLEQIDNYTQYDLRCYQLWDQIWVFDKCKITFNKNDIQTDIYCQCQYTYPVTLIGINTLIDRKTNVIIIKSILKKQINIYEIYLFWVFIAQNFITIPILLYQIKHIKKQAIITIKDIHIFDSPKLEIHNSMDQFAHSMDNFSHLNSKNGIIISEIHSSRDYEPDEITKQQINIDPSFIKQWFWSVYEITAIFKCHDKLINPFQKLILLQVNISFTFSLTIIIFCSFPYMIIVPFVLVITVFCNFLTKVLESLFNTQIKIIAYGLLGFIWFSQIFILLFLGTEIEQSSNLYLLITYLICIILQYTLIETIIILAKMNGLLAIKHLIKDYPNSPSIHIGYFILFNETLNQLFDQHKFFLNHIIELSKIYILSLKCFKLESIDVYKSLSKIITLMFNFVSKIFYHYYQHKVVGSYLKIYLISVQILRSLFEPLHVAYYILYNNTLDKQMQQIIG